MRSRGILTTIYMYGILIIGEGLGFVTTVQMVNSYDKRLENPRFFLKAIYGGLTFWQGMASYK